MNPVGKRGGLSSEYEPCLFVWELMEILEQMPFDAVVKLRVKNKRGADEHYSKDSDGSLILTGLVNQVFLVSDKASHIVLDAWPRALEHQR